MSESEVLRENTRSKTEVVWTSTKEMMVGILGEGC